MSSGYNAEVDWPYYSFCHIKSDWSLSFDRWSDTNDTIGRYQSQIQEDLHQSLDATYEKRYVWVVQIPSTERDCSVKSWG